MGGEYRGRLVRLAVIAKWAPCRISTENGVPVAVVLTLLIPIETVITTELMLVSTGLSCYLSVGCEGAYRLVRVWPRRLYRT